MPAINKHDNTKMVPLTISYFTYRRNDHLGFLLALSCLLPILFIAAQSTLVLLLHSTPQKLAALFLTGQLLNEGLNLVLKTVLKDKRPGSAIRTDWGLPSSHAQFMAFLAQCMTCIILMAHYSNKHHLEHYIMVGFYVHYAWLIVLLFWCAAGVVSFARIYDGSHYTRQVIAGICTGAVTGTFWGRLICHLIDV
jgi:dolichyldiphosphatase